MPAARLLAAPPTGQNYKLVFADEFAGTTLDQMKWSYNYSWGTTHNHAAVMTPTQVKINGGILNLQAIPRANPNNEYVDTSDFGRQYLNYSSGAINSSGKFNATQGYFEASIKLTDAAGSWPAFWMLQGGWPPEVDVMEFPRGANNSKSQYWANYHYTNASNAHASYGWQDSVGDLTSTYHTYGVAWTAATMTFYLDGVARHTINDAAAIADSAGMYMILNHAVGGWAGTPANPSTFTADYLVDWVRVWQQNNNASATTTYLGTATTGQWDTVAGWSQGAPKFQDLTAAFNNMTQASLSLDWANTRTVGGLTFNTNKPVVVGSSAGQLQLATTGAFSTIQVTAADTAAPTIAARLDLWSDTRVVNDSAQTLTISGKISGAKSLLKGGAGLLALSGSNEHGGGTGFFGGVNSGDGGTIRATSNTAFGTGLVTLPGSNNASQVIELGRDITVSNNLTTSGRSSPTFLRNVAGGNTWGGNITLTGTGGQYAIDAATGTLTLAGTLSTNLGAGTTDRIVILKGLGDGRITGTVADGSVTKIGLSKSDAGRWTLLNANTFSAGTTVSDGTLIVSHARALGSGPVLVTGGTLDLTAGVADAVVVPSLDVSGTGLVEIRNDKLVIDYAPGAGTTAIGNVRASLAAARIRTASAVADPRLAVGYADAATLGLTMFGNVMLDGTALVMTNALLGDTNLDGTVNFDDLLAVAQNYGATDKVWTDGDLTYDGAVGFDDLLALAQNYSASGLGAAAPAFASATFSADWALAQSLVPEPATLVAALLPAALLGGRRR